MNEVLVIGETKPGDVMERPFVAVPFGMWQALQAASRQASMLTAQLATEKALKSAILADYQAYMREHQVLIAKQKQERG